ncbi:MAG TPA: hypothetical protein VFH55_04735 [Nitrospiria bacterium]|nr:hypothetical protein [Nitrospiria bacterium]
MAFNTKEMAASLKALQTYRAQILALSLLPPDATALISLLEDGPTELEKINAEIAAAKMERDRLSDAEFLRKRADMKKLDAAIVEKQDRVRVLDGEIKSLLAKIA